MGRPVHRAHAALAEEALDPVFPGQGPSAEPFLGRQLVLEDAPIVGAEPWLIMKSWLQVGQTRISRGIGAHPEAV